MKTFDVPDTIPLSKVKAFLAGLGLPTEQLVQLAIGPREVYAEFFALNEDGKRYFALLGAKEPAMHRISIRLDREA